MALSFKIADIFVKLSGDAGELTKDFDNSAKKAKGWEKEMNLVGARVTNVFAGIAGSLATVNTITGVIYAKQSANIDDLAKRGRVVGASIGDLQELGLAASLSSGVLEGQFVGAIQKMTKRVSEASVGLGESRDAIKELGLDAKELAQQDPAQMFTTIVGALENVTDAKTRARLAGKVFDDEGIALANVTTEAIEQAADQIERMGGALTDLDAQKVEDANDAVTLFQSSIDLAEKRLTVGLAPAVEAVATQMYESILQGVGLEGQIEKVVSQSVSGMGHVLIGAGEIVSFIANNSAVAEYGLIGGLLLGKKGILIGGALGFIQEQVDELTGGVVGRLEASVVAQKDLISQLESSASNPISSFFDGLYGSDAQEEVRLAKADLRELELQLESLQDSGLGRGKLLGNTESLVDSAGQGLRNAGEALIKSFSETNARIKSELNDLASGDDVAIVDDTAPDGIADKVAERRDADILLFGAYLEQKQALSAKSLVDLGETHKTYAEELRAQEIESQGALSRLGSAGAVERGKILFGEFQNALAQGAKHSRSLFEFNKAVSMGNAIVSTYEAATNALATKPFWPVGTAMFTSAIATGLSAVSAIGRTQFKSRSAASITPDTPSIDTSTTGSVAVANEAGTIEEQDQQTGGMRVAVYTTPGASAEVQAAQTARSLAHAAELDLYDTDADGRPIFTGSDDDDGDIYSGAFALAS